MDDFQAIAKAIGEYVWFIVLAMIGGTINYLSRVKRNAAMRFSLIEMIGEWCISGFVGVMVIYLGLSLNWSMPMIGFSCGIAGHLGGRIMFMLDSRGGDLIDSAVDKWINKK